ncbi:hypothetical protein [Niveibacterium terrae]|uniref:hypothetical protein n=1 Tax=Niveibacterium terrae TaxID=3373598 RepID=UPI003A8F5BC3
MELLGVGASGAWSDSFRSQPIRALPAGEPIAIADASVSLASGTDVVEPVYALSMLIEPQLAWTSEPEDELSQIMLGNLKKRSFASGDSSSLLSGVGAKLLDRFSTTQSDFSQTLVSYDPDYWNPTVEGASINYSAADITHTSATEALKSAAGAGNRVGFRIRTLTGKTVDISLSYGGNGKEIRNSLSVSVRVGGGELSAAEKTAVAELSSGFESFLQSVGQGTGAVDVSGLTYDATVLSGIDLTVRQTPQFGSELKSLDFHANSKQRSFALETTKSHLSLTVDLTQPAILGSSAQQHAAVQNYLSQFDAASQRGHGDSSLLGQFKDVFVALHSNYPTSDGSTSPTISPLALNDKDRAVLTGLADFEVSLSGDFAKESEAGHMEYRAAQSTKVVGEGKWNGLSVSQTQTTRLKSNFLQGPDGGPLNVGTGNYESISIDDETSSITSFAYTKDELQSAKVSSLVSQMESLKKFVNFKVVEERDSPLKQADEKDISALLVPPKKR